MSSPAVQFSHIWKRFRLGESHDSLAELLAYGLRRCFGSNPGSKRIAGFWALSDVDFSLEAGESVGIIGPNGAGKSTALKLLAGILRSDKGTVSVSGRLAALIEIGAGFHGDLTGRENIFLNGSILGMARKEIRQKLDAIVEFAGLEKFLDTPVKRYSSGMYARLGFSIAAHVDPDVLLVDEVLSVGDAMFRLRCDERMNRLVRNGTALVFVTHNLEQMQSICRRAIVLERGKTSFAGLAKDAVEHYMAAVSRDYSSRPTDLMPDHPQQGAELIGLTFADKLDRTATWMRTAEMLCATVRFRVPKAVPRLVVEMAARATGRENIVCFNSARSGREFDAPEGANQVTLTVPTLPLAGGRYFWNVRMWNADTGETLLDTPFRFPLVIDDGENKTGLLALDHQWSSMAPDQKAPIAAIIPDHCEGVPEVVVEGGSP